MKRWEHMLCCGSLEGRGQMWWLKFGVFCCQDINHEGAFGVSWFSHLKKSEFQRYALEAIMRKFPQNLSTALQHGTAAHAFDDVIDDLIECAIDMERHECYVILVNYKHENNLYQDLKKKFEL